jgi:hypothetical protein
MKFPICKCGAALNTRMNSAKEFASRISAIGTMLLADLSLEIGKFVLRTGATTSMVTVQTEFIEAGVVLTKRTR